MKFNFTYCKNMRKCTLKKVHYLKDICYQRLYIFGYYWRKNRLPEIQQSIFELNRGTGQYFLDWYFLLQPFLVLTSLMNMKLSLDRAFSPFETLAYCWHLTISVVLNYLDPALQCMRLFKDNIYQKFYSYRSHFLFFTMTFIGS